MNWGWLFFVAFFEAIVTYAAYHWNKNLKVLVTIFTLGTALPFLVILIYGFIKIKTNPANAITIGSDTITATMNAFVDAVPSAVVGDFAGIVVGIVLGVSKDHNSL